MPVTSTTLTTLFGEHPDVRILDFLAEHAGFDYNLTDLARNAGVSRPATYKVVARLLKRRVLVRTRRVGTSWFYALNAQSPLVKPLLDVQVHLVDPKQRRRRTAPHPGVRA